MYYHSSRKRFHVGDIIGGRSFYGHASYCGLCLTNSPVPHYTIIDEAVELNFFIYEVCPMGKVYFGSFYDEYFSPQGAVIVRCVGRAKGVGHGKKGSRVYGGPYRPPRGDNW